MSHGRAGRWKSSHHALAMQKATEATVLGDFAGAQLEHFGVTTTFFRDGNKFMVRTDGPDGALQEYPVSAMPRRATFRRSGRFGSLFGSITSNADSHPQPLSFELGLSALREIDRDARASPRPVQRSSNDPAHLSGRKRMKPSKTPPMPLLLLGPHSPRGWCSWQIGHSSQHFDFRFAAFGHIHRRAKLATVLECDPAELLRVSSRPNT
jgi:hypothetical protein